MKRGIVAAISVLALAAGASRAQDEAQPVTSGFGDWMVACDNVRTCTGVGVAADGAGGGGPYLFLIRDGAANAAPRVEIGVGYSEEADRLKDGDRVTVSVDGPDAMSFTALIRRGRESYESPELVFPAERTGAFVRAVVGGTRVTLMHGQTALGAASLSGSSAALRYIDDQQKRAGTVTALVARGSKPASAVPAPPALPSVRRAPAVSQSDLPRGMPAAFASRADVKECAEMYDESEERAPTVHRLSATEYLWQIGCGSGAYNFDSVFIIARRDGTRARSPAVGVPGYPDHLVNGVYDPKTRQLSAFTKGRGLGDCGTDETWTWDGKRFQLVRQAVMEECLGVTSEHWIVIHRAKTTG